ncbi:Unknown protein, partial [Striga hermonthica]
LTPWESTYLDELHERRNREAYEQQLMEGQGAMVGEVQNREDDGALNFLILEDKESLEEEGNDMEVVINPGESDDEDGDGLDIWLENTMEEPTSPIYRPSCVRDWPKECGPQSKLKPKKRKTKRARRKRKSKTKESYCWCKPCTRKRRARKKEARRRGLRWEKDGWWIPAEDCERLKGWDPWPEPTVTIADEKGDGDRLMGEWRASAHDARGWTEQDDVCGNSVSGQVADVDWDALAFGGVTSGRDRRACKQSAGRGGACNAAGARGCAG